MDYDTRKLTPKQRLESVYERNRKRGDSEGRSDKDREMEQHYKELERDETTKKKTFSTKSWHNG